MAPRKPKSVTPAVADLKQADEGYQLARKQSVQYLHTRRQAMFALARNYHIDADDLHQEAYEILLTCLRDFNPLYTKADGSVVSVQFNTFFGNRLENRAMELRNRDPEYQARQAHMAEMSDSERDEFRKSPPLLVQHLDQESTQQEHLVSEVSHAQSRRQVSTGAKLLQDSFIEQKLNDLIAAERDDKRRAALQHVKAGGVSSFEEIAFHFGVTDSRASQIFNELMDAFYVQRLLTGDLKSVGYDFRKLSLNDKRAARLLADAIRVATERGDSQRAAAITTTFGPTHPELAKQLNQLLAQHPNGSQTTPIDSHTILPAQLTAEEDAQFPPLAVELRPLVGLQALGVSFRPPEPTAPEDYPHIKQLTAGSPEDWPPLLVTEAGGIVDGERRLAAARARGLKRVLCQVRQMPPGPQGLAAAHQLRVVMNMRVRSPSKLELYSAISALLKLGLAQGKIAELLGTSRPNVIVYAKLLSQGTERLQQLFTDGQLQITNASSAVDLPPEAQDKLADFIRLHGSAWSRGPQFAEAYEAAAAGQLHRLLPDASPPATALTPRIGVLPGQSVIPAMPSLHPIGTEDHADAPAGFNPQVALALKKRQQALENALNDADIWARQREATIGQQTSQIQDLRNSVETLKRELEAQSLLEMADHETLNNYLKDYKSFLQIQERFISAKQHLEQAARQLRSATLTHRQNRELEPLLEQIAATQTQLRVQLMNKGGSAPVGRPSETPGEPVTS